MGSPLGLPSRLPVRETPRAYHEFDRVILAGMATTQGQDGTVTESVDQVLSDIERIVKLEVAPIRNLWITQRYHTLMNLLATVIGAENANWSTFATWASKTAGQSIRGEEVPREIRDLLNEEARLHERIKSTLHLPKFLSVELDPLDLARAVLDEVSRQIAVGNLLVFEELAPLFGKFCRTFPDPSTLKESTLKTFVGELRPGPVEHDGQDLLKTAFTSYFAAAQAKTLKEKAEYTLYGNLLIGLHEQTRLQAYIAGALDAPFSDKTYDALLAKQVDWIEVVARPAFKLLLAALRHQFEDRWERLATRYLMRLALPNGNELSLGVDIPVGKRPFPTVLDPMEYQHLKELVSKYDPHLETLKGSGSKNWTELNSRMAFIADLFRSRQQDRDLYKAPFTIEQIAVLREGRLPHGPL